MSKQKLLLFDLLISLTCVTNSSSIRVRQRQRIPVHKKVLRTYNPQHWPQFRSIRNKIMSFLAMPKGITKLNFLTNLFTKSIPHGKWWRIAKSVIRLMKQNPSSPSIVCQYGRILVHPILGQGQWILLFFSQAYQLLVITQSYVNMGTDPLILNILTL